MFGLSSSIIAIGGVIVALFSGLAVQTLRLERANEKLNACEASYETRERIDNATSDDLTPDAVLDSLRRHAQ